MRVRSTAMLGAFTASLLLQGCVAAVLPIAAAGIIGKKEVDKARQRARAAEEDFDRNPKVQVEFPPGQFPPATADPEQIPVEFPAKGSNQTAENAADPGLSIFDRIDASGIKHPYLPMARFALEQAQRRTEGQPIRSALLVERVSLSNPQTIDCADRPFAVVIDLDPATLANDGASEPGFAETLGLLREAGVAIAWIGDQRGPATAEALARLRAGDTPVLDDRDVRLLVQPGGMRKQELRWNLARTYCVVAIAGDTKSDFDELFDYLRDPDYAIRLDMFMDKGWFRVPDPVAALGPDNTSSEMEQPQ
ncbi:hypothetical protein [Sphingorhabdus sp.]|uniref:hypothetical protein n=2 Tax=Sphingorhabdus sp. TaxID=1902408 RepID=UPI003BB0C35A|nr:hypothetical protein [Sphingomonadales bacterium]MBK9431241.1 hypothetical protein [Sphingomonadales bacterium]